jgi:tetraacyldisaccharide 4'-kinase
MIKLLTLIFIPISRLWEILHKIRRSFYEYGIFKKEYFKVPIISVGNLSFGGTGKTPIVVWLVQYLNQLDKNCVVLSRGYKGSKEKSIGLIKGGQRFRSNPLEFGDEPLLIARKIQNGSVLVGQNRAENLKSKFHELNPDVVVLDDGFQHLKLHRSLNILLFDAMLPIEKYKTFPLGYLREGLDSIKDADAILISRSNLASENKISELINLISQYSRPDVVIARFYYRCIGFYDAFDKKVLSVEEIGGKNVIALSALASPESFYTSLEQLGANIIEKSTYPDHYFFTPEDINDLLVKSTQHLAVIIASEKDMVKIRRVTQDPRILYMGIDIVFHSGEQNLKDLVKEITHR